MKFVLELPEGQLCRDNTVCVKEKNCETLNPQPSYETLERCGFSYPFGEELICCFKSLSRRPPTEDNTLNYLTSLQYNTPDLMNKEYRCTAIVVSPNHVLSTSKCEQMEGQPVDGIQIQSDSSQPDETYAIKVCH